MVLWSKVTWVRVAYPWSYNASSGCTCPGPLCTADGEASWARCVPLGTLQTQLSDLGTMIRKTNKRVIALHLFTKARWHEFWSLRAASIQDTDARVPFWFC